MLMDPRARTQALHIRCRGLVQGVGFRPFVYRLATELNLGGWVRNDGEGVEIEICGKPTALAVFRERLQREAPARARIESIEAHPCECGGEATRFEILSSGSGGAATAIAPDTAVCPDCLTELFDPVDRRHRYAFINCTQCGPRYTITRALPYDRAQTSMARFTQCAPCDAEYRNPAHRRFHAEPNACPDCGPQLWLADAQGARIACEDVIADALAALRRGEIVAVKGLGGFHLVCDAFNADAVARLRERKAREEKPFAVMFANVESARAWAQVDAASRALLEAPERPIVLLPKTAGTDAALPGIAPGIARIGAMLPYTPLHYLLFHEAAERPRGTAWLARVQEFALVMTSANPHGEPLVSGNEEAVARLEGIADAFLMHDREIVARCDDSVMVPGERAPAFIRRARGYVPRAIKLAHAMSPTLAFGGWFKNTVVLTRGDEAFVSPHIGDLDNAATCAALDETIEHMMRVLEVAPEIVAHDLHPDFYSTRAACAFAAARGLPVVGVQHHHAHISAVQAEHRVTRPVLGLALDGVGLGTDGRAWGGELLRVDGAACERIGHLRELPLPGGDRAAREPWRMAAAALHLLQKPKEKWRQINNLQNCDLVAQMLERGTNTPLTSSMGRWFDAAAGLLGVRETMAYEGQAAMLLEGLADAHARAHGDTAAEPLFARQADGTLDLLPLLGALAEETDAAKGAARFHATLAAALESWLILAADRTGIATVAFGGGCFLNRRLSRDLRARCEARGLTVLEACELPPNDGGIALGQAWVAALAQAASPTVEN